MKKKFLFLLLIWQPIMATNNSNVIINSPLKGEWTIYNPPGHAPLAFDLLAVDTKKSLYKNSSFFWHLFSFIDVKETLTWEQPIFSPVSGEQIAQVGNSGSSIQPHLHLQVMQNDKIFPLFENLLPFQIKKGEINSDEGWSSKEKFFL